MSESGVMWSILWWCPELVLLALFWMFATVVGTLAPDEMTASVACTWIAISGLAAGAALGVVKPSRMLPPGAFLGVSLLVVPVVFGLAMELSGRRALQRGGSASHLGTWYGGAIFGFGLAVGRLGVLWQRGAL